MGKGGERLQQYVTGEIRKLSNIDHIWKIGAPWGGPSFRGFRERVGILALGEEGMVKINRYPKAVMKVRGAA